MVMRKSISECGAAPIMDGQIFSGLTFLCPKTNDHVHRIKWSNPEVPSQKVTLISGQSMLDIEVDRITMQGCAVELSINAGSVLWMEPDEAG